MERVDYQPLLVQDLVNLKKSSELDLNPWYQRRSVWTTPQKAYLINTLFVRMPVPTIYVRYVIDLEKEVVKKEVVDGQQRSRAILEFHSGEFSARHPEHKKPVKFAELTPAQRTRFLTTPISVGYLVDATDQDVIEMFGRVNSVSKSLNDQERRNARFGGEFKQFSLKQAASRLNIWRNNSIFSATEISRMAEVQFISDVVLNLLNGLSDFSQKDLDKIYQQYEDDFPKSDEVAGRLDRVFEQIASLPAGLLKDTIFHRSPVFFSLILALDKQAQVNTKLLADKMYQVDGRFSVAQTNPENADPADLTFRDAVVQTSQRLKNRSTRQQYLNKQLFS